MNLSISLQVLRDLRHDNVNSFLGCVQRPSPSQGLALLTDYAARGSLRYVVTYLSHKNYHTNLRLSSEPCSLLIFILQRTCRFQGHSLSFRYHFGRYVYFFTCDGHPSWTRLFARVFKDRISWEPQSKFLSKKISIFFQSVEFVNLI